MNRKIQLAIESSITIMDDANNFDNGEFIQFIDSISNKDAEDGEMMTISLWVDKDLATYILEERNPYNRRIKENNVKKMIRDYDQNKWNVSHHQGIAFDANGNLIDGQHRLHAIVEADALIPLLASFNIRPENITSIDRIARRTIADMMRMRGLSEDDTLLASVNKVYSGVIKNFLSMVAGFPSNATEEELVLGFKRYSEAVIFASTLKHAPEYRRLSSVYHRVACARAFEGGVDEDVISDFWSDFIDGGGISQSNPVRKYRDKTLMGVEIPRRERVLIFEKMISSYAKNPERFMKLKSMRYPENETFPVLWDQSVQMEL
jgi:hypothetical protein